MPDAVTKRAGTGELSPASPVDWWALFADPDFLKSPYKELKRIRDLASVHYDAVSGVYFALSHDVFRRLAMAPEMGRDTRLWTAGWNSPRNRDEDPLSYELFSAFQPQMTNANPPDHRRMRDVYEKAFRQTDLEAYMPLIEAECERLINGLPTDAPVDFMEAVANPLARSIARIVFQVPQEMEEQVAEWVAALSLIGNIMISPAEKQNALTALRAFKAYLRERIASGIDRPEEGFVGLALAAFADRTMDEEESLNNLVTLMAGGTAIATLVGNGLLTLIRHPAQFEKLRSDRSLLRPAIEEMLRFEPGGSFIIRVAIRDFQCGGILIPAGSLAVGLVAATSRDPECFADPDVFDIARQPNPHMVFGVGPHICIGKALVRMTAGAAFTALMNRFGRIELAGEPVWWTHRSDQHGLHSLPLRLGNGT